jgi:hypothetical protein
VSADSTDASEGFALENYGLADIETIDCYVVVTGDIPATTDYGLIFLVMLLVGLGTTYLLRRRRNLAETG